MFKIKVRIIATFSALEWIGQHKVGHYLRCTGIQHDDSLILFQINLRLASENKKIGSLMGLPQTPQRRNRGHRS